MVSVANNGDGGPREHGTGVSRPAISSADYANREFLIDGIDDLAKYRIVGLLYECPSMVGDAAHYATHLGFHSVDVTHPLLDELAESGILNREQVAGGNTFYRLVDDSRLRRRLMPLYASGPDNHQWILRLLASRSLVRAEQRAKMARRRDVLAESGRSQIDDDAGALRRIAD